MTSGMRACVVFLVASCAVAQPVKLNVRVAASSIAPGVRTSLTVELRDGSNRVAAAPKPLQVTVKGRLPSDEDKDLGSLTIPAGATSGIFQLPSFPSDGFVYLWARHAELREGGTYLRVKTPVRTATAAKSKSVLQPKMKAMTASGRATAKMVIAQPVVDPKVARLKVLPHILVTPRDGIAPPAPAPPPPNSPAPDPPGARHYEIALRYSPQRTFLADGKDPVTVHAFAFSDDSEALPGFRLTMSDGSGRLNPKPLIIRPGEEEGTATLTYDRAGDVKVELIASSPDALLDGDRAITIRFDPPITQQVLEAKPSRGSILDTPTILLTLADESGRTTATKEPRKVTFSVDAGSGTLSASESVIEPDSATARVEFTPLSWGKVEISAKIDRLLDGHTTLQIDPPYQLLGLASFGGLLGGFLFLLRHRDAPKWRIPVGALTGLMLVWAMLTLGLSALPRTAVLNPLSIVMIATLGGWVGTELFEPLLQKLGIGGSGKKG